MRDAVRTARATGANLKTLNSVQSWFDVLHANVKRVAAQLSGCQPQVDAALEGELGGESAGGPRTAT